LATPHQQNGVSVMARDPLWPRGDGNWPEEQHVEKPGETIGAGGASQGFQRRVAGGRVPRNPAPGARGRPSKDGNGAFPAPLGPGPKGLRAERVLLREAPRGA